MWSQKTQSEKEKIFSEFLFTFMNKPPSEPEIVPILYHLADDPAHMRLLEVCRQDIEVLEEKKHSENTVGRLHSFVLQAHVWLEMNSVTELPKSGKHFPSPGTGLIQTKRHIQKCVICVPVPHFYFRLFSKSGVYKNFHCDAHKEAFHAVPETYTWNCCDPPYHPANQYSWRKEDPWKKED